jgi:hypothetical protein
MKRIVIIVIVAFLIPCCKQAIKDVPTSISCEIVDTENILTENNVRIDFLSNYSIALTIDQNTQTIDLNKEGVLIRYPELMWKNADYACFMTWWSQAQSRHIFVPLKKENKFVYIDKDIEDMDSENSNVLYINTVSNDVLFVAENLLTRKKTEQISLKISEENCNYPYYDSIKMMKEFITIITPIEKRIVDIRNIY